MLIDEIDKADLDFPNDLLRELDRLEFEVPEIPGRVWKVQRDRPELRPIIFITHNVEKPLPAAYLRRCVYHYVKFPDEKAFLESVLEVHGIGKEDLRSRAVDTLLTLRKRDLQKKPGLSELLDWVGYLDAINADPEALASLPYEGALIKDGNDLKRVAEAAGRQ